MKKQALSILMWLVISAAFVGPGTVTTAASAGAGYRYQLLWALLFSTLACILLQEGAARASIAGKKSLGGLIAAKYPGKTGQRLAWLMVGTVVFGCIAYEAGNILGAVAGISIAISIDSRLITAIIGVIAGLLLYLGNTKTVTNILGAIVATMGVGFLIMAIKVTKNTSEVFTGLISPALPEGSALLALGLVGTTIVPYNLFLGSGISEGQAIRSMRWGVIVAVIIGGIISMSIVLAAVPIQGEFSFEAMAQTMQSNLGVFGRNLFVFGLFAAGFTSAVTAPLASAISVESLQKDTGYVRTNWFKTTWFMVLVIGLLFGIFQVKPVPAIILAQALNGLLLPFLAIALWLILNDDELMGKSHLNGIGLNAAYFGVVVITCLLGLLNIAKAIGRALGTSINTAEVLPAFGALGFIIALLISFRIKALTKLKR
ncbi:MAG: divalent metal cation transporter [Bacteroidota bacterium]